jgi:hypothetical protein
MALLALLVVLLGLPAMTLTSESSTNSPAQPAARATLKIVGIDPVAVAGRAFKPGERVRLSADGRRKSVTASARGSFKVFFPVANGCNGLVVVARGSEGSRATVAFANFSNVHCLEP